MDIGKLTQQDNLPLSKAMILCAPPHPQNKNIIKIKDREHAGLFLILKERVIQTAWDVFDVWKRRPL